MPDELYPNRFRTDDPDVAGAVLRSVYRRSRLTAGTTSSFRFRQDLWGDREVGIVDLAIGGDGETGAVLESGVIVVAPRAGRYDWRLGELAGRASTPYLAVVGDEVRTSFTEVELDAVNFDAVALQEFVRTAFGDDRLRLRFDRRTPVTPEAQRALTATIEAARPVLAQGAAARPALVRAVHRELGLAAVAAFGGVDERVRSGRRSPAGRAIAFRDARAFLERHAGDAITADDAARHVGFGAFELARLFRERTGASATEYLRAIRLDQARAELRDGSQPESADDARLADLAARAGFASAARFARHYRLRFGEDPRHPLAHRDR